MGREVRRVAPDWEHPTDRCHHSPWKGGCDYALEHDGECLRPLYEGFGRALEGFRADPDDYDGRRPSPYDYMPEWGESATAFQVYENVSEGTPISPVFQTRGELVDWLVNDGSGLGIGGRKLPLTLEQAESFADSGCAPSMIYTGSTGLVSGLERP